MAQFSRSAVLEWSGDVRRGIGTVTGSSDAFRIAASFPRIAGEPEGTTTPEELLAASHATCFGIGLRSVIAERGGSARRVRVTATITAEKGAQGIRVRGAHLDGVVEELAGIEPDTLGEIGRAAEEGCTISILLRASVAITLAVRIATATTSNGREKEFGNDE